MEGKTVDRGHRKKNPELVNNILKKLINNYLTMNKTVQFAILLISFFVYGHLALAQSTLKNPSPPWMAHSSHMLYLLYSVDAQEIRPLIPDDIKLKVNEENKVVVGLELYNVDRSFGQGNNVFFFIFAEIEDYDTPSGSPGHWAVWGAINDQDNAEKFNQIFGYPYEYISDMKVKENNGYFIGSIQREGNLLLEYKGKPIKESKNYAENAVNMVSKNAVGKTVVSHVPYINTGSLLEVEHLKINSHGNPTLKVLVGKTPFLFYLVEDAYFSYSAPMEY